VIPAFSATLTTPAIVPEQLAVIWTLILKSESEGPALISCAARLLQGGLLHRKLLSAPSRRTIIGIAHHDHVARRLAPTPLRGPQVEDVVQVEVRQQRRNHCALGRPLLTRRHQPVFQDTGLEPFLDQPEDAPVADPVFQEADQPVVADRVEGNSDRLPTTEMFRSR
jgi:hypothetical protein